MNMITKKVEILKNNLMVDLLLKNIFLTITSDKSYQYMDYDNKTFKNRKIFSIEANCMPNIYEFTESAFDTIQSDDLLSDVLDLGNASLNRNDGKINFYVPYRYQIIGKYYTGIYYASDLLYSLEEENAQSGLFREFYELVQQIIDDFNNDKINLFKIPFKYKENRGNIINLYSFHLVEEITNRLGMALDSTYTICYEKGWRTFKVVQSEVRYLYLTLLNSNDEIILMLTPNSSVHQINFNKLNILLPKYDVEIRSDFTRYHKLLEKVILENKTFKAKFDNKVYKLDKNQSEIHKMFFYKHIMPLLLKYHNQGIYTESKHYKYVKPNRHSKKLFLALTEDFTNSSFYNSIDRLLCKFFSDVAYNKGSSSKQDLQIIIESLFDKNKFDSNKYYFPSLLANLFVDPLKGYGLIEYYISEDEGFEEAKGQVLRMLDFKPRKYDPSPAYYTFMAIDKNRIVFNLNNYNYDRKVIANMNLKRYKIKEYESLNTLLDS